MPRPTRGPDTGPSSQDGRPAPGAEDSHRQALVDEALYLHGEQPMVVLDDQQCLLFFNRAAEELTQAVMGQELELGTSMGGYLVEDVREKFAAAVEQALGGRSVDLTLESPNLDRTAEWREYRIRPVQTVDGTRGASVVAVDLAARRWADEQFSAIFDAAPIPMAVLDADARIRQVNGAYCDQLGVSREDVLSQSIAELAPPDIRAQVAEEYRKFARGELGSPFACDFPHTRWYSRERRYVTGRSQVHWADVARVAIRQPDGELDYMLVMLLDTTEYKQTQLDLEKEKARTQAVFEAAVDGIITVDERGRIRQFNRAAEEIYGYCAEEVVGRCVSMLMTPEDRASHDAYVERHGVSGLARLAGTGGEFEGLRKDGTVIPIYLSVGEVRVDHELSFAGIVHDLSEHKSLQERVRRAERMEALGQLAGGIAHDFNNVLTIVNSYAHTGLTCIDEDVGADFYFEKIRAAAQRGARLTRQLLTFSPEEMGRPARIDLNRVVHDLEALVGSVIEEDIVLDVVTGPDVPSITADPTQIEQVLMNLVVNARDAMPHGGELTISTRLVHLGPGHEAVGISPSLDSGDYAMLVVRDTGHGMDEETKSHVFEPFFTTKIKGTGLGLATVYGIVQRYGGEILIDSEPGRGTTFSVYFPASGELEEVEPEPDVEELGARTQATETVLIVEDEEDIREPLRMVLEAEGYTVLEAESGDKALEIVEDQPEAIDLVVTDVVMPGVTGVALAESLRKQFPSIRSVIVSGYSGDALERKEIDAQQVRLSKPYDLDELLDVVRDMLSSR